MNKVLAVLVLVACLAVYSEQQQPCPPTQEYDDCGTKCPPTCNVPPPDACTLQCVSGCFCKPGLVLKYPGANECVAPSDCPS